MTKVKITVFTPTYNRYNNILNLYHSLQKQTFCNFEWLVIDDGSSDGTVEIIKQLAAQDSRIHFINENHVENVGVIKSFHTLLKYGEADFYCFSDQDDFWLPEKISLQVAEAKKYSQDKPLLIYTDLKVVDENLSVLHESMIRTQSDHANTELIQELTENTVTGGVAMINHALAELWTGEEKHDLLMHDWYLGLLASAFGNLVYIDEPTELYRQHSSNVLGARTLRKRMKNWVRPHILFAKYWSLIKASQDQARNLLELPLSSQNKEIIENFVTIMDAPFRERLARIRKYGYRKNRAFHTTVFTTLILTKFAYRGEKDVRLF